MWSHWFPVQSVIPKDSSLLFWLPQSVAKIAEKDTAYIITNYKRA